MGYSISLESIEVQSPDKYVDIDNLFKRIRASVVLDNFSNKKLQRKYGKELYILIFKLFGLRTKVSISDCRNAYVIPLYANKRHVMAGRALKKQLEYTEFEYKEWDKTIKNLKMERGYVDMRNAKVSGVFSTHLHEVGIDMAFFFKVIKFEPRTLVAVLFHELGHAFHMIAMSHRAQIVNVTMEEITRAMYQNKSPREYAYMVKDLEGVVLDKDQVDTLTNIKERPIFAYQLSKAVMTNMPELNKYADVSNERMADNFASRCGYSTELAKGLSSITPNPSIHFATTTAQLLSLMYHLAFIIGALLLVTGLAVVGVLVLLLATAVYIVVGFNSKNADMTYDDSVHRLNSIRMDLIMQIRQYKGLSKDAKKTLLYAYDSISKLVDKSYSRPSVANAIANLFSSKGRHANNEIEQQRQIERLGANSLYIDGLRLGL